MVIMISDDIEMADWLLMLVDIYSSLTMVLLTSAEKHPWPLLL